MVMQEGTAGGRHSEALKPSCHQKYNLIKNVSCVTICCSDRTRSVFGLWTENLSSFRRSNELITNRSDWEQQTRT